MNHEEADLFLDAIVACPEEATNRLVYADWLDDQEESEFDPKLCGGTHRHPGVKGVEIHGVRHNDTPYLPHHHHDEKCFRSNGCAEAAAFWRDQKHFPYEARCKFARFFEVAPILSLFPTIAWVEITDVTIFPSGGNDTYYVGSLGLFPQPYWRRLDSHRTEREARLALNQCCLEHLWSLRPPCQTCLMHERWTIHPAEYIVFERFRGKERRRFVCTERGLGPDILRFIELPKG